MLVIITLFIVHLTYYWIVDYFQLVLKPYHFAVFSVNLVAPSWEGTFAAEVIIVTQFEVRLFSTPDYKMSTFHRHSVLVTSY